MLPDVYLSPGYAHASAIAEGPDARVDVFEHMCGGASLSLPLVIRPIPNVPDSFDATTPYGYGGPVSTLRSPTGTREAFDEWADARNVVATFLRLHPLMDQLGAAGCLGEPQDAGQTVAWPTGPDVDLLASMRKKHRQYVRKAERGGLRAIVQESPETLAAFANLYAISMDRLDALDYYYFPPEYWSRLVEAEDVPLLLVDITGEEGLEASLLCLVGPCFLHAHLLGSTATGRDLKAPYLAYYTAARWAQENDRSVFHLGGGHGDASDLLYWKTGFCPDAALRQFRIVKIVNDPGTYRALAGTDSTEGFFPPWRQPLVTGAPIA